MIKELIQLDKTQVNRYIIVKNKQTLLKVIFSNNEDQILLYFQNMLQLINKDFTIDHFYNHREEIKKYIESVK